MLRKDKDKSFRFPQRLRSTKCSEEGQGGNGLPNDLKVMVGRGDFLKKALALRKCSNNFGKDCRLTPLTFEHPNLTPLAMTVRHFVSRNLT